MRCNWVNNKPHGSGVTKIVGNPEETTNWVNGEVTDN